MGPFPKALQYIAVDVREEILRHVPVARVTATIVADEAGILAGVSMAKREAERLGLSLVHIREDGSPVERGDEIARFTGSPKQVVMAEESMVGMLAKPSGIATMARRFVEKTDGRPKVVCGAWKKMPAVLKEMIRGAVSVGSAHPRIVTGPFAYLDKNYIELLGGIRKSLAAVAHLEDHSKVVQVKGRHGDIVSEAREAAEFGADIVFVDTGRADDARAVAEELARRGLRGKVMLAFGGGVNLEEMEELTTLDIDILDIGRPIVDAPLLDMRLEIIDTKKET